MKVYLIFILFFCSSFAISDCFSQVIVENLKSTSCASQFGLKKDIKEIVIKTYYNIDPVLNYDLSLFDYSNAYPSITDCYYNLDGNITSLENEYTFKNLTTGEITFGSYLAQWEYDSTTLYSKAEI